MIELEKLPNYESSKEGIYPVENKTTYVNISIKLKPVGVSGIITYNGNPIEEATIFFERNESVERNTAEDKSVITDKNGRYDIDLQPGYYNVRAEKRDDKNTLVYQLLGERITIEKGSTAITKDFVVNKLTATLQGTTKHNGTTAVNVSLAFVPDAEIQNNTASPTGAKSDATGFYSVEIAPGAYNVHAGSLEFEIDGANYTYEIAKESGDLTITDEQVGTVVTFDIELDIKESG